MLAAVLRGRWGIAGPPESPCVGEASSRLVLRLAEGPGVVSDGEKAHGSASGGDWEGERTLFAVDVSKLR